MEHPTVTHEPLVVGVRFRAAGPVYDFDAGPLVLAPDDRVLVETERGPALGIVATPPRRRAVHRALHRVLRLADDHDVAHEEASRRRERQLQQVALDCIRAQRLRLKLVRAEAAADGSRALVFVSSEERVDLRGLAREIGTIVQTRVEVRQMGSRDAARLAGGMGVCGRELCCSSWLKEFAPVSVKMAKAQGLALNPSKLAGQCGRLKCCLRYEYETYAELRRGLPPLGTAVQSTKGDGTVVAHNLLRQTVTLRRADDGTPVEATLEDLVAPRNADA
jgi:cell fate regulator YaaT (PSP1 superfamily)